MGLPLYGTLAYAKEAAAIATNQAAAAETKRARAANPTSASRISARAAAASAPGEPLLSTALPNVPTHTPVSTSSRLPVSSVTGRRGGNLPGGVSSEAGAAAEGRILAADAVAASSGGSRRPFRGTIHANGAGANTGAGVTRPKTEAEMEADRRYEERIEEEYARMEGGA